MKKVIISLLVILTTSSLYSNNTSPFQFLRTTQSARSAALGGASMVLENDPSAVFFNPALIYTAEDQNISVTGLKHVLDINQGNFVYINDSQEENFGVLAAIINFNSYGSFDRADENGIGTGTFGGGDFSFGIGVSNELDSNFYYGITAKFIYSGLEDVSTNAYAVDAGLFYRLNERSNLGVSILNAGGQITRLNGENSSLPLDVRVGANHRLRGLPILANISFHHLADQTDNFFDRFGNISAGLELYLGKYLMVRGGYDNMVRRDVSADFDRATSGFTFGVGAKVNNINIDYGMARYGSAGYLHRLSLNFGV